MSTTAFLILSLSSLFAVIDPLARMLATADTFRQMTLRIKDAAERLCDGKLVLVHEGGYSEVYVPFCGHATIASGAALGEHSGLGSYKLYLNDGEISVEVSKSEAGELTTTLQSPKTWSEAAPQDYIKDVLDTFKLSSDDLNTDFPPRFAFAGAKHLILVLKSRQLLSDMSYEFDQLKTLMSEQQLVTVNLLWRESKHVFHSRNPFPTGGVYEDPATGAAAAAFGGYCRDIGYDCDNHLEILQGHDMKVPSRLLVEYSDTEGEGISVTGESRNMH